jgi:hypothetical protein
MLKHIAEAILSILIIGGGVVYATVTLFNIYRAFFGYGVDLWQFGIATILYFALAMIIGGALGWQHDAP